jgi:hypothetical protein
MSRTTHAGGITRVVILIDSASRPAARPWPAMTLVRGWDGAATAGDYTDPTESDNRAFWKRVIRRRARNGKRPPHGMQL